MAQKRMLNKSISLSSQVNKLNLKHKFIFTWCIPHLDDWGLIDNDPEVIKATVCPMVKDITIKDIREFMASSSKVGLIEEYQDCLDFTGFDNHQSLSEEKKAKSKFSRIPRNPQENIGENNIPQKSPVQGKGREGKGREVKGREDAALSPQQSSNQFFEMVQGPIEGQYLDFIARLHEATKIPTDTLEKELRKFTSYWLEKNKSGTKSKWELERTFEVNRRLAKWLENAGKWSKEKGGVNNKYQVNL